MKYKNVSKDDLAVIGVGFVKSGEVIETDEIVNNQYLVKVKESK